MMNHKFTPNPLPEGASPLSRQLDHWTEAVVEGIEQDNADADAAALLLGADVRVELPVELTGSIATEAHYLGTFGELLDLWANRDHQHERPDDAS